MKIKKMNARFKQTSRIQKHAARTPILTFAGSLVAHSSNSVTALLELDFARNADDDEADDDDDDEVRGDSCVRGRLAEDGADEPGRDAIESALPESSLANSGRETM